MPVDSYSIFRHKIQNLLALAAVIALLAAPQAIAQNLYGTIRGTVVDPSGAIVPGATVTLSNVGTGITKSITTGADGTFEFVNLLAPADYDVSVTKSGFRAFASQHIHLNVNQVYVVSAALEVGNVAQTVTVEASTAQIDTTTMQLGTTISNRTIVDLPLNGRNWTQLQQLEPGVVASSDRFGTYSTNGAETQQNSFLVNGVDTNDLPLNEPAIIPSPDALGEFRMITNTINPEYGRNSGAIMNAVIKNGTNGFHGDGFEFYRDTFLDARSFFQSSVSPFQQNQFGGTLGGPIVKDHAFFFVSYEGTRATTPQAFAAPTVFDSNERSGNFSGLPSYYNANNPEPANSPCGPGYTGPFAPNPLPYAIGSAAAGTPYCTAFPSGILPSGALNPLSVKLMNQFVPLPNAPNNEYQFNPLTPLVDDQVIYRVDDNIGTRNSIWGYGLWERRPTTDTLPFTGATLPGFPDVNKRHYQEYTAAWNHTFSATTLNEARFSYFRFNFDADLPQNPINPTSYGFAGIIPQDPTVASLPVMSITGLFTIGYSANAPQPRIDQTYEAFDNFTRIMGHHTFKAGFTMERFETYNPFFNNLGGNFSFSGAGTFSTGSPGADFLLGLPDTYAQGSGSVIDARSREYYSYAQDQWQARPSLTLTLGLGWDVETPYEDKFDYGLDLAAFRPSEQSRVFPTAPLGIVYPGDPGINKYGGPTTPLTDFAPRVGFAWSPGASKNWVVRGGFGLYYNRTEEELVLQGLTNPPFSVTSTGVAAIGGSPSLANPYMGWCPGAVPTACSSAQVFPFTPPAKGSSPNFAPFEPIGFGMSTQSPNFGVPMSENYNLTVQRQLSPSTILSVGYVGNVGRHLEGAYNDYYFGTGATGLNPGAAALGCNAFDLASCDPGSFLAPPGISPLVQGSPGLQVTDFNSNYNSLQVGLTRRFTHGLAFDASYTWSRYFDYTSNLENSSFNGPGIYPYDIASMYAPSANDAPQRLVINYVYVLPFYHLAHRWQPLTDGWTLTGITTFQHGFPIPVSDSAFPSLTCDPLIGFYACPDRANRTGTSIGIGDPRNYTINGATNYWFNPKAFAVPALGTGIGDASRNPLYGPGLNNWDIALMKDIHITESKYFELRLETYNTFNHTQFAPPNPNLGQTDVNSSNFGQTSGVVTGSTNGSGRVLQLGGKFYF